MMQQLKKRTLELCFARQCYDEAERHNRFCIHHWQLLPEGLQRLLWSQYSVRQDVSEQCASWKRACIAAIELLAAQEGTDRWDS